jgi:pimeloyl-ACP methyl ester carboxylesterase
VLEKDITIDSAGNKLAGTICLPGDGGPFPGVLMVPGSGPLDRDENMRGQRLDVFNTIAHFLAGRGIASLRYDKRGCGKSTGDYYSAGHFDLVEDAATCFDELSRLFDSDRLFILGHSEGCIIAPQVSQMRPATAGLVLLCPFVEHLESVLIRQATQIEKEVNELQGIGGFVMKLTGRVFGMPLASQRRLIRRIGSTSEPALRVGLNKIPARWFRELMQLDPPEIFSRVTCPMLLIGGEKDLQCDPADVARIAELARGPVSARLVPNLTHILRLTDEPASLLGSPGLFKQPLAPVVLDMMGEWMAARLAAESSTTE